MKKEYRRRSLKFKLFLILIVIAILFDVVISGVSYVIYTRSIKDEGIRMCTVVTQTVASDVNSDTVSEFVNGKKDKSYTLTAEKLVNLMQSFKDIKSIYIYALDPQGMKTVFSVGANGAQITSPGSVTPYADFGSVSAGLENGESISPIFTGDTAVAYSVIKEESGKVIGYCECSLSVKDQMANRMDFVTRIVFIVGIATILIVLLAYFYMSRILISPINKMEASIRKFADDNSCGDEVINKLEKIKKSNVDEIIKMKESFTDLIGDVRVKQTEIKKIDNEIIEKMMSVIDEDELKIKED